MFLYTPNTSDSFPNTHSRKHPPTHPHRYLLLDEKLRFLDCSEGGKRPSRSILDVGIASALADAGFDEGAFEDRGGVYEWRRDRDQDDVEVVV